MGFKNNLVAAEENVFGMMLYTFEQALGLKSLDDMNVGSQPQATRDSLTDAKKQIKKNASLMCNGITMYLRGLSVPSTVTVENEFGDIVIKEGQLVMILPENIEEIWGQRVIDTAMM